MNHPRYILTEKNALEYRGLILIGDTVKVEINPPYGIGKAKWVTGKVTQITYLFWKKNVLIGVESVRQQNISDVNNHAWDPNKLSFVRRAK